jgi:site-specific DNA-methyltransferase (adenine-specific)
MNNALMFSKASDEWSTPQDFYDALDAEFHFVVDAAATADNAKVGTYYGPDRSHPGYADALAVDWAQWLRFGTGRHWCNPPYSKCREFVAKAAQERQRGVLTVMLLPARTDTRWFHDHLWQGGQAGYRGPRPGIEIRFWRGRLKFGGNNNSAPFPSMVVVFRP